MEIRQAADYLHISVDRLRDFVREKRVSCIRYTPNGKIFFTQAALDKFIEQSTQQSLLEVI